jgi:hypothetical protein
VIGPAKDVIDSLNTPIPGISSLAGEDVSLLTLPEALLNGIMGSGVGFHGHAKGIFEYIEEIKRLIAMIDSVEETIRVIGETGVIPIGDFNLLGDLRQQLRAVRGVKQERGFNQIAPPAVAPGQDLATTMDNLPFTKTKGGFSFPIIDKPSSILQMILGHDIPLILYTSPQIDIDMSFGFGLPIPGITAKFSGAFKLHAGITMGYDTKGIVRALSTKDPLDALDGFYLDVSTPLLTASGNIRISVELNAIIFRAGVYGM